ncbi:MAG: type II toxin-antitoxin system VapC family toxin [Gemmatimonadetes bacterium]|nr:type II toxin-antitoxin system VapC family toxin [Gemmatimonadota bacterium]
MALLLDTHAFLWFIDDDPRLSPTAAEQIGDPAARVLVSVVSLWEIVIKLGTGKLSLDRSPADLWPESLAANHFEALPVTAEHVLAVAPLPLHHRDPFDRLLLAQAVAEGLQVVSADTVFDRYPVERIW